MYVCHFEIWELGEHCELEFSTTSVRGDHMQDVADRYSPTVCDEVNTASGLNLESESKGGISQGHEESTQHSMYAHTKTHTQFEIQVFWNHRLPQR